MIPTDNANRTKCELAAKCWYVTGATASGKTEIGLNLATRIDAEIISLDSMAIYREMDIGTAKPSRAQRQRIPHHMIDIVDPVDSFSVSQYRGQALEHVARLLTAGKQVVFVGGTALYLKAMLRGVFEGPPADWEFRKEIETELADVGVPQLHARLQQVDPLTAHKLHPNDQRRIVRALEVYKITGRPISYLQNQFEVAMPAWQCKVFALRHPRQRLHQRIQQRVDRMFQQGLVDEVRGLLQRWTTLSHTAAQAVGYREVIEHLGGNQELDQTIERVRVRTRRFARHQETWFRGLTECRIIDVDERHQPGEIADRLLRMGSQVAGPA